MKKIGISLLLVLVLVTTLLLGIVGSAYAAKPVRLGITITDISEGSITVSYWWNKIQARYLTISISSLFGGVQIDSTGLIDLEGRTPSQSDSITFTSANITCGDRYTAYMCLFRTPAKRIRGAQVYAREWFLCPPPSCNIFYEGFSGVDEYTLPAGWGTSNISKTYVMDSHEAVGYSPELYIDYGDEPYTPYDYCVHTPVIDATTATSALNLTFRHALYIYDFAANFTYSVEVSNNAGLNWTAVLEETPTQAQYPDYMIGPERVEIDLSAYVGDQILIGWRLRECTFHSSGWYIDDVCVNGLTNG